MAIGASLISGLGKAARFTGGMGNRLSGRTAMTALAGGAFFAGMANKAGPTAMDAAMETAFGDANADRYFTGRDLSLRTMVGGYLGGNIGTAMQMSSPGDYMAQNPNVLANPVITGGAGAVAGGIVGGFLGRGKGAMIGAAAGTALGAGTSLSSIVPTNEFVNPIATSSAGSVVGAVSGGLMGKMAGRGIVGTIAGGMIGGIVGGMAGAAAPLSHIRANQQFFKESPYSPMVNAPQNLNATGDIVLGMHNARKGY